MATTPVFLPGESQGWRSLVGCRLWGRTEPDTTKVTQQQQQQQHTGWEYALVKIYWNEIWKNSQKAYSFFFIINSGLFFVTKK